MFRFQTVLSLSMLFALGGALGGGLAYADTVVFAPAGEASVKARYVRRVARSLKETAAGLEGVSAVGQQPGALSRTSGPACSVDAACLANAGRAIGATRVVGVLLAPGDTDKMFQITFLLVDVETSENLAEALVLIAHRKLTVAPGAELAGFLSKAASQSDEVPAPVPEATPEPEATPQPEATPEPEVTPQPETTPEPEAMPESEEEPEMQMDFDSEPDVLEPESVVVDADASPGPIHIGIHTGVMLPQLSSELGTTVGFKLEAGYRVWKNLSPFASVGYAQPTVDGALSDPRLGADYMTSTTQRELTMTVGAMWRFLPPHSKVNAYGGLGARTWLLETITNGDAGGATFLENRETSTRYGVAVLVGGEFSLGPGAAVAEVDFGSSDLPHMITGDVATTAIFIAVGYRLMF